MTSCIAVFLRSRRGSFESSAEISGPGRPSSSRVGQTHSSRVADTRQWRTVRPLTVRSLLH